MAIETFARGDTASFPQSFQSLLSSNPERLAKEAERIVSTMEVLFERSRNADAAMYLGGALTGLPDAVFKPYASRIFALVKQNENWISNEPGLFIRAADAGMVALPYYGAMVERKKPGNFLKFAPVLAICRIGSADPDLREKLKTFMQQEFVSKPFEMDYAQSLFLALLSIGERQFATEQLDKSLDAARAQWFKKVLEKSLGQTRPNNCMTRHWPVASFLGKPMLGNI